MKLYLCDTGPLVSILSSDDENHARCVAVISALRRPLITTWPCFTEAMYLLFREQGFVAQEKLWGLLRTGALLLHDLSETELERMPILMRQYRDTPMDLADASLVAAAETLGATQIFTLDSDFFVYRLSNGAALAIVP